MNSNIKQNIANSQDSHIQIPNRLLESFAHYDVFPNTPYPSLKAKGVWALDVNDGKITVERCKTENTQKGYFDDATEILLQQTIETPLSEILNLFKKIDFKKPPKTPIQIPNERLLTIKKFCIYSMLRGEKFSEDVNRYSIFTDIYGGVNANYLVNKYNNGFYKMAFSDVENSFVSILLNCSNINFIVPRSCAYVWVDGCIVLPLSGKVAAYLTPAPIEPPQRTIIKDEIAWSFNIMAIAAEIKYNRKRVYADDIKILEALSSEINYLTNQNEFNKEEEDKLINRLKDAYSRFNN